MHLIYKKLLTLYTSWPCTKPIPITVSQVSFIKCASQSIITRTRCRDWLLSWPYIRWMRNNFSGPPVMVVLYPKLCFPTEPINLMMTCKMSSKSNQPLKFPSLLQSLFIMASWQCMRCFNIHRSILS